LETLSGRATRGKNPSVCPTRHTENPLPDTLRTRSNPFIQRLRIYEQNRPDEG
jgi:hypothetical protein